MMVTFYRAAVILFAGWWTQPFSPKYLYLSKKTYDVMLLQYFNPHYVDFIP